MPGKWIIEKAVWLSDMPAPRKTIMAALLFKANSKSGQIPDEYTPSLSELVALTSLSRSTVTKELNLLEEEGWVRRDRPSVRASREEKKRTKYWITIPKGHKTAAVDRTRGDSKVSDAPLEDQKQPGASPSHGLELVRHTDQQLVRHTDWLVREADQASPSHGPELVRHTDIASPSHGPNNRTHLHTSSSSARDDLERSPKGRPEEEEEEIDEKRKSAPPNRTVLEIAAACGIDHEHAGRAYVRILARGNVGSPARFCAELIRNGDIAQYLDPPAAPAYAGPTCDFVENPRDPGRCTNCRMPEGNRRHAAAA